MKKIKYFREMVKIIWEYDKKYMISFFFEIVLFSIYPFLFLQLINQSIGLLTKQENFQYYLTVIIVILVSIFVISILRNEFNNYSNIKGNLIGQKLFRGILDKCMSLDYQDLHKKEIIDKKELALKAINGGAFNALVINFKVILGNIVVVTGMFAILMQAGILLLFITLIVVALNGLFLFKQKKSQYNAEVELAPINREGSYYVGLSSDFSVAKEIRLFDSKKQLIQKYDDLYNRSFKILKKMFLVQKRTENINTITSFLLDIVIYSMLGFQFLIVGSIDIAGFSVYVGAVQQVNTMLSGIINTFADIDKNGSHLKDYFEFINIESVFTLSSVNLPERKEHVIKFDNVSFRYPGQDNYALRNISITIKSGEKISIVGKNGSGKTTFIKLLTRLMDPTEGKIYIDDVDISEIRYKEYQSLFSTVFQDFSVYSFSVRDNVTMMKTKNDQKDDIIWKKISLVGLKEKIERLPKQLDTNLSRIFDDTGTELSGGQNQKLAISRALYKDSQIVILDEPTAALDPQAEHEIYSNFNKLVEGKTAIYISHRLSSCKFSDSIFVFLNGELVEQGNHNTLIKKKGEYEELFNMQAQYYN